MAKRFHVNSCTTHIRISTTQSCEINDRTEYYLFHTIDCKIANKLSNQHKVKPVKAILRDTFKRKFALLLHCDLSFKYVYTEHFFFRHPDTRVDLDLPQLFET